MKFGYTIIYVPDVEKTMAFYAQAFQLQIGFLHESKQYGELDTGSTKLAFVAEALSESNGIQFSKNRLGQIAAGFEIALTSDNVQESYTKACEAGAVAVHEPSVKPWGQTIAYVRDINGVLIEICSPMA